MRVTLYPADEGGCGFYRILEPARTAGITEVKIAPELPIRRAIHRPTGRWVLLPRDVDADVLVFQRVVNPEVVALIPALQHRGHAVVMDIDDDLTCLHPAHPTRNASTDWRLILKACARADLVTVTTPALAERYAPHGRVAILPNRVPQALLDMPRSSDGRTAGWAGGAAVHPGDLEVTSGGVGEAVERADARFLQVGPENAREKLRIAEDRFEATGLLSRDEYYEALGRLDVGIVPLADSKFNAAKSTLKGIEYAARGVAFVASPTPEYAALSERGAGVLAGWRSREWRREVLRLLKDPEERRDLAERGKQLVARDFVYETQGWRWAEAWEQAIANHRQRSARPIAA